MKKLFTILTLLLISACSSTPTIAEPTQMMEVPTATNTATFVPSPTMTNSPTLAPTATEIPLPPIDGFIKGVTFAKEWWDSNSLSNTQAEYVLDKLIRRIGAEWIVIIPQCFLDNPQSVEIQCTVDVPGFFGIFHITDSELIKVVKLAKSLGYRVVIKPHLFYMNEGAESTNAAPGGHKWQSFGSNEEKWKEFFVNYSAFITHYAELSEKYGVDYFVVGTEMAQSIHREKEWRQIISEVRDVFSGKLTYASHGCCGQAFQINWWDALDAIGVNGHENLIVSSNPNREEIKNAFQPFASKLDKLSNKFEKPIIFTEIAWKATDGILSDHIWSHCGKADPEEQADGMKAFFDVFNEKEWFQGIFYYAITNNGAAGGMGDVNQTPFGKPAEVIMRTFFDGPIPAPTTIAPEMTEDTSNSMLIYDDALQNGWNWSEMKKDIVEQYNVDYFTGNSSIKLVNQSRIVFDMDEYLSKYYWLEFYIKLGPRAIENGTRLMAYFVSYRPGNTNQMSWKPVVTNPKYLEGGNPIQPNEWTRVRIPLKEMGIENIKYHHLFLFEFSNCFEKSDYILVDDIRLVGAYPVSP